MKSNFGTLNWKDLGMGAIVAVLTAILATLTTLLNAGTLFDKASLTIIGTSALTAFLGYITTYLFTNSAGQPFKNEKSQLAIKLKNTGKLTKILIIGLILSGAGLVSHAQGLFKPVPKDIFIQKNYDNNGLLSYSKSALPGKIIWRWDVGISGVSYDFKKGSDPVPFSAIATGPSFDYYENNDGIPWNVWGASLFFLKDTKTNEGFGIGLYGKYNTNMIGIINAGCHYDFAFNKVVADVLLTFSF
jgi:hypothetical protein